MAVIEAPPVSNSYTVTLDSDVSLAGLVLDRQDATLTVGGTLDAPAIALRAGTLLLDQGTLTGTLTQGALIFAGDTLTAASSSGDSILAALSDGDGAGYQHRSVGTSDAVQHWRRRHAHLCTRLK
jgi:hypothetical protein